MFCSGCRYLKKVFVISPEMTALTEIGIMLLYYRNCCITEIHYTTYKYRNSYIQVVLVKMIIIITFLNLNLFTCIILPTGIYFSHFLNLTPTLRPNFVEFTPSILLSVIITSTHRSSIPSVHPSVSQSFTDTLFLPPKHRKTPSFAPPSAIEPHLLSLLPSFILPIIVTSTSRSSIPSFYPFVH